MKLLKLALALLLTSPSFAQSQHHELGGHDHLKLLASDGAADDQFGSSVAIDGNLSVIGAHYESFYKGAAYVLRVDTGGELHKLTASNGFSPDRFGTAVDIDGITIVVGSPEADGVGSDTGAVYVFNATTGVETTILEATDGEQADFFGSSVATHNGLTIVGAHNEAHPVGPDPYGFGAGAAYLFDTATGVQLTKFIAEDGYRYAHFGNSVAISNDWVAVGAFRDDQVEIAQGAVYLYDITSGFPYQEIKITAGDFEEDATFGDSVVISGDYLIVTARGVDKVYVYDINTQVLLYQLENPDLHIVPDFTFATSIAADDQMLVVGSRNHRHPYITSPSAGAVFIYDLASGLFKSEHIPFDGEHQDNFGEFVAASNNMIIVGAPNEDENGDDAGAAYTYEIAMGLTYCSPAEENSNHQSAWIEAYGSRTASDNDFTISVHVSAWNEIGYAMASMNQAFIPFAGGSEGNLCLGSGKARFTAQAQTSDIFGHVDVLIDLTNIPTNPSQSALAGQTWNWQWWYRDGTESNFSDAVSVTFQ